MSLDIIKRLLLFNTILILSINLPAQYSYLNISDQEIITERLLKNKQNLLQNPVEARSDENFFVPINFTIFQSSSSKSLLDYSDILDIICDLNSYYSSTKIRFFLHADPAFITNQTVYNDPLSTKSIVELTKLKDYNALNVFITSNTFLSPQFQNIVAYYTPQHDWILINESEILNANSHFLAHEVGHYFSLLHTFNGWEKEPFNLNIHGVQADLISPDGITLTEHADRSACDIEGDYICDTNADYNFGFGWIKNGDTCHDFDQIVFDPDGEIVNPEEANMMGYFLGCKDYFFSDMQGQIMEIDYLSENRNSLRWHNIVKEEKIINPVILLKPLDNERILEKSIFLEWEPTQGATSYLLTVEYITNNKVILEKVINNNYYLLENLENGSYTWKVRPLNSSFTCAASSNILKFNIDNSLSVTPGQNNKAQINLIPNFVGTKSVQTSLYISNNQSINLNVDLYDINGRLIEKLIRDETIPSGVNSLPIPINKQLIAGLYIIKAYSYNFEKSLKLIIQ